MNQHLCSFMSGAATLLGLNREALEVLLPSWEGGGGFSQVLVKPEKVKAKNEFANVG